MYRIASEDERYVFWTEDKSAAETLKRILEECTGRKWRVERVYLR